MDYIKPRERLSCLETADDRRKGTPRGRAPQESAVAWSLAAVFCAALLAVLPAPAETPRHEASSTPETAAKVRVDYISYRPACWETDHVEEVEQDSPNKGGLINVYFTNTSESPVDLAYYRCNEMDQSHWLLGRFLAWDRLYDNVLDPGEPGVLEINAVSKEFSEKKPFSFSFIDRNWRPVTICETVLREDAARISSIIVMPGMNRVIFHVRYTGQNSPLLTSAEVLNHSKSSVSWVSSGFDGPGHSIGVLDLDRPLSPGELLILRVGLIEQGMERRIYSHRRAFVDSFPIGVWSSTPETLGLLKKHHVDLVVKGYSPKEEFFLKDGIRFGIKAAVPTSPFGGFDALAALANHHAAACWLLSDEPDWSVPPVVMLHADQFARRLNTTKPTFITLCRNVKFFEYAPIADIPCMDHYCVSAPSSSRWPTPYGTRLEETAYYTRDLKAASEPKPIWVWSQAIASWDGRPQRPVPTPDELAAQLMLNLGRGAKGILWFNYEPEVAKRYTDVRDAMRLWGRVLRMAREDFLLADPVDARVRCPRGIDTAALVNCDKMLICLTNTDYDILPEGYDFQSHGISGIEVRCPPWINPELMMEVGPNGVSPVKFGRDGSTVSFKLKRLDVCSLLVLANDKAAQRHYKRLHEEALADEKRDY